jgi:hypothetical protein
MVASGLSQAIEARLRAYLEATTPDPLDLRGYFARLGALPLWLDMGGGMAIRPDGVILSFAWDGDEEARVEGDRRRMTFALYRGSLAYPELAPLVPARPEDARTCIYCLGAGEVRLPDGTLLEVTCACGGLGWVYA